MSRFAALLLFVVATSSVTGCKGTGFPHLFGAGSTAQQQHQAQKFDPYPETGIGPSVTGGRPESYTEPAPEPTRGTANRWTIPWFGKR